MTFVGFEFLDGDVSEIDGLNLQQKFQQKKNQKQNEQERHSAAEDLLRIHFNLDNYSYTDSTQQQNEGTEEDQEEEGWSTVTHFRKKKHNTFKDTSESINSNANSPVYWLPEDLWRIILSFLSFVDLLKCQRVCRQWKRIADRFLGPTMNLIKQFQLKG